MEQHERQFKGIWIPANICEDEALSPTDKFIWAEINSLCSKEKGCYASNRYLAYISQCSERQVTKTIGLLKKLGYITTKEVEGRYRIIHTIENYSTGIEKTSTGIEKCSTNNIDNNSNR